MLFTNAFPDLCVALGLIKDCLLNAATQLQPGSAYIIKRLSQDPDYLSKISSVVRLDIVWHRFYWQFFTATCLDLLDPTWGQGLLHDNHSWDFPDVWFTSGHHWLHCKTVVQLYLHFPEGQFRMSFKLFQVCPNGLTGKWPQQAGDAYTAISKWSHHQCDLRPVLLRRHKVICEAVTVPFSDIQYPQRRSPWSSYSHGCPHCYCSALFVLFICLHFVLTLILSTSCMWQFTSGPLENNRSRSSRPMPIWMYTMATSTHWSTFWSIMKGHSIWWWQISMHRWSQ